MPLLALAVLVLAQNREDTKGKSNAQILAMGRDGWYRFYTKGPGGESTAGMSSAEGLYGDALAWRNDRLRDPRTARLRKVLQATRNDALAVGSATTGGGTMWNIATNSLYADAEGTVYAVLTKGGKAPKRVVSDVDRAYRKLQSAFAKADVEPKDAKSGRAALVQLRKDLDSLIAEATRWPRKGSDALLDFGVKTVGAANAGG